MARAPQSQELLEGTRLLDRYTIVDRIGSGGMATIYRAKDDRLDRIVCVKLLRTELEGSGSTDGSDGGRQVYQATYSHFLEEAQALSKLQHPNTLRIYDFGYLSDGRPFQISEFLDGGDLEVQVRTSGPFDVDEMLSVVERIASAIGEAHQRGILHRDIKPSNILFSRVGLVLMPKLADFGIARSRVERVAEHADEDSGEPTDLVSTVALFSPRWAAPEQIAGGVEGPYTDVYALGLVVAFMLGGKALFADADVRSNFSERIRGDEFVGSRLAELGIEEPVRGVLLRALASDPAKRIASPQDLFDELRAASGAASLRRLPTGTRKPLESITLVVEAPSGSEPTRVHELVAPAERGLVVGGRRVRVVEVGEKLDFTVARAGGDVVRFRVTMLPSTSEGFSLHLKGLSCFVARPGSRPTPALVASTDGIAELVGGDMRALGSITWSFGEPSRDLGAAAGRVFGVDGTEFLVPYSEAAQSVAIDLGPGHEVIVMGRR